MFANWEPACNTAEVSHVVKNGLKGGSANLLKLKGELNGEANES